MSATYSGFYARFEAPSKKIGGILTGADTLVGDEFEILFKVEDGATRAWAKNRFGAEVGFFDADATRKMQLANARGMQMRALLSFVAYSDSPDPGIYWGEMAIICYEDDGSDMFPSFVSSVAAKLCEGVRTDINLGSQDIAKLQSDHDWLPKGTIFLPETSKGSAILKSKRLFSEKVVEQGRRGNIGCYIASFIILAAAVALILWALHSCGVF